MNTHKKVMIIAVAIIILLSTRYRYITGADPIWFNSIGTPGDIENAIKKASIEELNMYNEDGLTGLMYAAEMGMSDNARWLLNRNVDVDARSKNRQSYDSVEEKDSALHFAIRTGDETDGYEIALMILNNKNKAPNVNIENHTGNKPIHEIIHIDDQEKRVDLIKLLLMKGANINAVNYEGNTMLHLSVEQNSIDWIRRLEREFGWKHKGGIIDLEIQNNQGNTAYSMAMERGFTDLAGALSSQE